MAVELKLEKLKPAFKGQMEFYLKWLNRYERQPDEKERLERRRTFGSRTARIGKSPKQIDYFYESKDDEDD